MHRTSFALDEETAERLQRLSRRWNVSQAEVVRRAVQVADEQAETAALSVAERLEQYRAGGRIAREDADAYLEQVQRDRSAWTRGHDSP